MIKPWQKKKTKMFEWCMRPDHTCWDYSRITLDFQSHLVWLEWWDPNLCGLVSHTTQLFGFPLVPTYDLYHKQQKNAQIKQMQQADMANLLQTLLFSLFNHN